MGRTAQQRKALLSNMTSSLLERGHIVTTRARAKQLQRFFDPLVTRAKQEMTLSNRRYLLSKLMKAGDINKLIEAAEANKSRPGGYLRLTKLPTKRQDQATTVKVEIITK